MPRIPIPTAATAALLALVLAGCAPAAPSDAGDVPHPVGGAAAGTSVRQLEHDGERRSYRVHVPESLAGDTGPVPLVVMLHGGFGSAEQAENAYGWDAQAEAGRFVVAYPDGLGRAWNAGDGCCGAPGNAGADDVGFVEAVVADLVDGGGADDADGGNTLRIDRDRVFATGMSNGGMMAYRLACETDTFAAVAPVAGTLLGDCPSPAPVSVLAVHGLADSTVPVDGSPGDGAIEIDGAPLAEVIDAWRAVDDCTDPVITAAPPVTTSLADCADERQVGLITVADAGHQWPGARSSELRDQLGGDPPSTALDATAAIWAFFAAR